MSREQKNAPLPKFVVWWGGGERLALNLCGGAVKDQSEQSQQGYDARAIANLFLFWANEDEGRKGYTPIEIIKLVYIAHGWCLALLGKPLIFDQIEAWKHGPVISSLYHTFKRFGRRIIQGYAEYKDMEDDSGVVQDRIGDDYIKILSSVYHAYSDFIGYELARITHEPNSPWDQVRKSSSKLISNDLIKAEYENIRRHRRS